MRRDTIVRIDETLIFVNKISKNLIKRGYRAVTGFQYSKGYVPRNTRGVYLEEYDGRYGKGYILHMPCWESTRYHYIQYFVK